jgi:hypothetical protein
MGERRCSYCQKSFQPSKFQARQTVCGEAECQRERRTDYHRGKLASVPNTVKAAATARENGAPATPNTGSSIGRRILPPLNGTGGSRSSATGSESSAILQTTPQLLT